MSRWVTEMIGWFGPVGRARSTASPVGSIGMVWRQGMDFWNVWKSDRASVHGQYNRARVFKQQAMELLQVLATWGGVVGASPSLSELLAEGMLSSRSGMLSSVARSSLCTTIFSLPFDLSISFLASISDKFSVTVPLICRGVGGGRCQHQKGTDQVRIYGNLSLWCQKRLTPILIRILTSFKTMILYLFYAWSRTGFDLNFL